MPLYADVELTANGGGGATWTIATIQPGEDGNLQLTGTVSGVTVGYVSDVYISPNSDVTFASAGQISVQTYAEGIGELGQIVAGYNGELAADPACPPRRRGEPRVRADRQRHRHPADGSQQDDTFVNVLQSCEDMDRGQLYEPRDAFGIGYRTRISMQGQSPVLTLDYSAQELAGELVPIADDQFTRNYLTITRNNGSNAPP